MSKPKRETEPEVPPCTGKTSREKLRKVHAWRTDDTHVANTLRLRCRACEVVQILDAKGYATIGIEKPAGTLIAGTNQVQ